MEKRILIICNRNVKLFFRVDFCQIKLYIICRTLKTWLPYDSAWCYFVCTITYFESKSKDKHLFKTFTYSKKKVSIDHSLLTTKSKPFYLSYPEYPRLELRKSYTELLLVLRLSKVAKAQQKITYKYRQYKHIINEYIQRKKHSSTRKTCSAINLTLCRLICVKLLPF